MVGAAGVSVFCREGAQTSLVKPSAETVPPARPAPDRARVVLVRDADALEAGGRPRAEVIARMLDQAGASVVCVAGRNLAKAEELGYA